MIVVYLLQAYRIDSMVQLTYHCLKSNLELWEQFFMYEKGPSWGMRFDEAPILKVCELQGCRPTMLDALSQRSMKWNETHELNECGEMVEWNLWQWKTIETSRKTYPDSVPSSTKPMDHRCGLGVTSLLLTQWSRVRSPVGSISWLRLFTRFSLNHKSNFRKFGPHSPRLSYGHHISSKPYAIRLRTVTVSGFSCSTWSSLNNKQTNNNNETHMKWQRREFGTPAIRDEHLTACATETWK